ncbi:MAG: response regulator [Verrucomicrobiota bacterium]
MEVKRVLVVDDEVTFTSLVKLNLEKTGQFTVREVNDPLKALTAAREFKPDIALLDVIMPGKDGGQVLAELRAEFTGLPVIFVTATMTQRGLHQRDDQINGVPFIAKPVEAKKLIKRIEEVLED